MNQKAVNLLKSKNESWDIYQTLCNSQSMYNKYFEMEFNNIAHCITNTLGVMLTDEVILNTGSESEGTTITSEDYSKSLHSMTPCYISDKDYMQVLCYVQVIDEGDPLPEKFDDYIYCQAERGEHTTDGFRKLRIIHRPEPYLTRLNRVDYRAYTIYLSIENGFISSSAFLKNKMCLQRTFSDFENISMKTGVVTKGPSQIIEMDGSPNDMVECFYVKTWPNEAESWFTRQAHWPDGKLKSKIRKIGYILVPIGNSQRQESHLEWRCSFSMAEKILFQSMTKFQRCTFILLKVLLKEYLPSDINTDGEKQLLSTYHIKTLFLWSLEDSKLVWEPEHMLANIGHMFGKMLRWIKQKYIPHYFIPSVNLLPGRHLQGRETSLIRYISAIRNDLFNKIKQSKFFMGQKPDQLNGLARFLLFIHIQHTVMHLIIGLPQSAMHQEAFIKIQYSLQINFNQSLLIKCLTGMMYRYDVRLKVHHLHKAIYTDAIHETLLTKVVPGLIDQYRGCIHLAKYCMAARDGRVLPDVLHTAESLLMDTLHLDPCSGYVKLVCLYIVTGNFVQAMDKLHVAENNFMFIHKNMTTSALRNLHEVEFDRLSTEVITALTHEVFQKWTEGQVISYIVVTWLEYITGPDLLQFEIIHEIIRQVTNIQYTHDDESSKILGINYDESFKMVKLDCHLQWPPLSMIKLLKFVCTFNSGQLSTSYMENSVADLIASSVSIAVFEDTNDIYTVLNMAAWLHGAI